MRTPLKQAESDLLMIEQLFRGWKSAPFGLPSANVAHAVSIYPPGMTDNICTTEAAA